MSLPGTRCGHVIQFWPMRCEQSLAWYFQKVLLRNVDGMAGVPAPDLDHEDKGMLEHRPLTASCSIYFQKGIKYLSRFRR